jgi:hypothetical protein
MFPDEELPGCDCPECTAKRQKAANLRTVDKLKQMAAAADIAAYGKSPVMSVLEQVNRDLAAYGSAAMFIPAGSMMKTRPGLKFEGYMPKWYAFDEYSSNVEPDKPKHRKDVKVVAKVVKLRNEDAMEHSGEAIDMIREANDILRAADNFSGKTVFDVRTNEDPWKDEMTVTFVLKKINAEEDAARREEYQDKPLYDAFNLSMQTLGLAVQGMLQKTGRGLFADATLAMHRLAKPELTDRAEKAKAAAAANAPVVVQTAGDPNGVSQKAA